MSRGVKQSPLIPAITFAFSFPHWFCCIRIYTHLLVSACLLGGWGAHVLPRITQSLFKLNVWCVTAKERIELLSSYFGLCGWSVHRIHSEGRFPVQPANSLHTKPCHVNKRKTPYYCPLSIKKNGVS